MPKNIWVHFSHFPNYFTGLTSVVWNNLCLCDYLKCMSWKIWRWIHGNIQLLHSRHMFALITLSGLRAFEVIFEAEHWGYESIILNRSYCLIVRATSWIPWFVKIYWVSFIRNESMRTSNGSYWWLGPNGLNNYTLAFNELLRILRN